MIPSHCYDEHVQLMQWISLLPANVTRFIRFGIGRFTTVEEVDFTAEACLQNVTRLREMRYENNILKSLSIYVGVYISFFLSFLSPTKYCQSQCVTVWLPPFYLEPVKLSEDTR